MKRSRDWGRYEVRDACDLFCARPPVCGWDDLGSAIAHADDRGCWVASREGGEIRVVHAAATVDLGELETGVMIARGARRDEARGRADAIAEMRGLEAPAGGRAEAVVLAALHAELPAGVPLGIRRVLSAGYSGPRKIEAQVEMLDGERGRLAVRQVGRGWAPEWEPLDSGNCWSFERRNGRRGWTDGRLWAA